MREADRARCDGTGKVRGMIGRIWSRAARLAVCLALLAPALQAKERVDVALVLAADISFSVGAYELDLQRRGYVAAFRDPQVIAAMTSGPHGKAAIAYLEWAGPGTQVVLHPWTIVDGQAASHALADALETAPLQRSGETSISAALDQAAALFRSAPFAERWVIDMSSDGYNNSGPPVNEARDRSLYNGITINGLPIVTDEAADLEAYFNACVTGGPGSFTMAVGAPEDFAKTLRRKMILELAGRRAVLIRAKAPAQISCDMGEEQSEQEYNAQIDEITQGHPESWRFRHFRTE